jgi:transposase
MRPVTIPADDLEAIAHDRYHHPAPLVQRRMEVVWLYHHGHTQADCATLAGVGHRSAQRYLDAYRDGGLAALRRLGWKGTAGGLDGRAATLEDYFLQNPPRPTAEARDAIERLTGVRRGLTQVRQFFLKWLMGRSCENKGFVHCRIRAFGKNEDKRHVACTLVSCSALPRI